VIERMESKSEGRLPRRSIRGAVSNMNSIFPVTYTGNKQIEKIKINKSKLKKIFIGECQSFIFKYIYNQTNEIKDFFYDQFNLNERQFYRYLNGERTITDKEILIKTAAFISIFLSEDQKFKYYPTYNQEVLDSQIGYQFCKATPLFAVNPTLEEMLSLSFLMNEDILFHNITKISKDLGFTPEESFQINKSLFEKTSEKSYISKNDFIDFFHMMDSDGSFIDKETIIRSSNQSVKERIKVLPSIEKDILQSMPSPYILSWKTSKNYLGKLRNEISRIIKNKKIIKRDLLNDKLAGYFR
tara:strand:- start:141 stop:1037 length:897 start_codon:yes stop_codon:yes gene_type:complete